MPFWRACPTRKTYQPLNLEGEPLCPLNDHSSTQQAHSLYHMLRQTIGIMNNMNRGGGRYYGRGGRGGGGGRNYGGGGHGFKRHYNNNNRGRGSHRGGGRHQNNNHHRNNYNNNRESASASIHNIGTTGTPTSTSFTVAVQGCSHGELDSIYEALEVYQTQKLSSTSKNIDILLCCGDVQTLRNTNDYHSLNVPPKYKAMGDFHAYYSGQKVAPILTIMIGGNHESSNYLQELHYGGWVAPNTYFLGAAGVVNVCKRNVSTNTISSIRIGGLSGIYNSRHYKLGRYESPPYDQDALRSVYHTREVDVKRLQGLATTAHHFLSSSSNNHDAAATNKEEEETNNDSSSTVDVMISHDWPRGIAYHGDMDQLLRKKPYFKQEIENNELGSPANEILLNALKPKYWFAAHLHVKFEALVRHEDGNETKQEAAALESKEKDVETTITNEGKTEEVSEDGPESTINATASSATTTEFVGMESNDGICPDSSNIETLTEQMTRFLSLDKCLPKRRHIQITHVEPSSSRAGSIGIELTFNNTCVEYDVSCLPMLRRTHGWTQSTRRAVSVEDIGPITKGEIEDVIKRFEEGNNSDETNPLVIPQNFVMTAPPYDASSGNRTYGPPPAMIGNPQTDQLLEILGLEHRITVPFSGGAASRQQETVFFQREPPPPPPPPRSMQQLIPSAAIHHARGKNNMPSHNDVADSNEIDLGEDEDGKLNASCISSHNNINDENEIDLDDDDEDAKVEESREDPAEIDIDDDSTSKDDAGGDTVCFSPGAIAKKPRVDT